jgi:hypothetical protein
MKEISGIVSSSSVWGSDGQGVTTTIYENQDAAEAAVEKVKVMWGGLAEFLTAAPSVETYDNFENLME